MNTLFDRPVRSLVTGLALAAVLGLSACGSSSADAPVAADPTTTEPPLTATATPTQRVEWSALDTGVADVDGDGRADQVALLVPANTATGDPAAQSALQVTTASGTQQVQVTDSTSYVAFLDPGPLDLDGNGAKEVVLFESEGGDSGAASVWTWHDGRLTLAAPAVGSPKDLATPTRLSTGSEETGVALQDGGLYSWRVTQSGVTQSGGQEVTVWKWALDGATLHATQQPGTRCVAFGVLKPC